MAGLTVRRCQLGSALKDLREAANVTQRDAALAIGCSQTQMSRIEGGRHGPTKTELIVLLQHYHAGQEHFDVLEELRQEASRKGWWSQYRLPEWLAGYVGLETDAETLRAVALELIPGLLQTETYARNVHAVGEHMTAPEEVDRRVAARMRRQKRLTDPSRPLGLSVVVSEAALRRCTSNATMAPAQLQHLVEQADLPNVEVRVLTFAAGLHPSMAGSFSLMSFPAGTLPDAAYQEYAVGGHVIDDDVIVARLDTVYGALRDQALGPDESLALISELLSTG